MYIPNHIDAGRKPQVCARYGVWCTSDMVIMMTIWMS